MKFKVSFSGFHYVDADSLEEAKEKSMHEDDIIYSEQKIDSIEEIGEFIVCLED